MSARERTSLRLVGTLDARPGGNGKTVACNARQAADKRTSVGAFHGVRVAESIVVATSTPSSAAGIKTPHGSRGGVKMQTRPCKQKSNHGPWLSTDSNGSSKLPANLRLSRPVSANVRPDGCQASVCAATACAEGC